MQESTRHKAASHVSSRSSRKQGWRQGCLQRQPKLRPEQPAKPACKRQSRTQLHLQHRPSRNGMPRLELNWAGCGWGSRGGCSGGLQPVSAFRGLGSPQQGLTIAHGTELTRNRGRAEAQPGLGCPRSLGTLGIKDN